MNININIKPQEPVTQNQNTIPLPRRKWTPNESNHLLDLVKKFGKNWKRVAKQLKHRRAGQCQQKYVSLVEAKKKFRWSNSEDELIKQWVTTNGPYKWFHCAKRIKGRIGKQCRERWFCSLNPVVNKGKWSVKEQGKMFNALCLKGPFWSQISKVMISRTNHSVKLFFKNSIRRFKTTKVFKVLKSEFFSKETVQDTGKI